MKEHNRDHSHTPARSLGVALGITGTVFFAELIGGWLSGSIALMADAAHMLSDATGLILALIAVLIGKREVSEYATFGYRRVEVLAAAVNAVTVVLISIWIVYEAVTRLGSGTEINTRTMIVIAVIGLIANAASAAVLHGEREHSMNVEGAFLHVLVDMLGSVAVVVAGIVIATTGFQAADVIASLIIAGMVIPRAWGLLRTSTSVLLERVPAGVEPARITDALLALDGVDAIHDLHLWSASGTDVLCSVHLITEDDHGPLLDAAQARLRSLGIAHATIQIESPGHTEHEVFCAPHDHP